MYGACVNLVPPKKKKKLGYSRPNQQPEHIETHTAACQPSPSRSIGGQLFRKIEDLRCSESFVRHIEYSTFTQQY